MFCHRWRNIFFFTRMFFCFKHKHLLQPINISRSEQSAGKLISIALLVTSQARRQRRGHYLVRLSDANPWVKKDKISDPSIALLKIAPDAWVISLKLPGLRNFNSAQSFTYHYRINPYIQLNTHQSWVTQKSRPCSQAFRIHKCSKCRLWIENTLLPLWLISYHRWRYRFCSESVGALLSGGLYRYGELGVWKYAMAVWANEISFLSTLIYIFDSDQLQAP